MISHPNDLWEPLQRRRSFGCRSTSRTRICGGWRLEPRWMWWNSGLDVMNNSKLIEWTPWCQAVETMRPIHRVRLDNYIRGSPIRRALITAQNPKKIPPPNCHLKGRTRSSCESLQSLPCSAKRFTKSVASLRQFFLPGRNAELGGAKVKSTERRITGLAAMRMLFIFTGSNFDLFLTCSMRLIHSLPQVRPD